MSSLSERQQDPGPGVQITATATNIYHPTTHTIHLTSRLILPYVQRLPVCIYFTAAIKKYQQLIVLLYNLPKSWSCILLYTVQGSARRGSSARALNPQSCSTSACQSFARAQWSCSETEYYSVEFVRFFQPSGLKRADIVNKRLTPASRVVFACVWSTDGTGANIFSSIIALQNLPAAWMEQLQLQDFFFQNKSAAF